MDCISEESILKYLWHSQQDMKESVLLKQKQKVREDKIKEVGRASYLVNRELFKSEGTEAEATTRTTDVLGSQSILLNVEH